MTFAQRGWVVDLGSCVPYANFRQRGLAVIGHWVQVAPLRT